MRGIKASIAAVVIAAQAVAQAAAGGEAPRPVPDTIEIPAGAFVRGSDRDEREAAYRLDEAAYGHSITRKNRWYEDEPERQRMTLPAFQITRTLITRTDHPK